MDSITYMHNSPYRKHDARDDIAENPSNETGTVSRLERTDLHVSSGVSSCYAVKPSALQKTRIAMMQSRKKSLFDDLYPPTH
jgi:hypothetical protein